MTLSPVQPNDSSAERAFVAALSLTSRYRRFHFGLRELTPEQSRAMTEVDQHHHVAFVARPVGSTEIVADARYVLPAVSADAEFAIAVADDWQGAGLGRELLLRLAADTKAQGVQRLFGEYPTRLPILKGASPSTADYPVWAVGVSAAREGSEP